MNCWGKAATGTARGGTDRALKRRPYARVGADACYLSLSCGLCILFTSPLIESVAGNLPSSPILSLPSVPLPVPVPAPILGTRLLVALLAGNFPSSPILCRVRSVAEGSSASDGSAAIERRSVADAVAMRPFIRMDSLVDQSQVSPVSLHHREIMRRLSNICGRKISMRITSSI